MPDPVTVSTSAPVLAWYWQVLIALGIPTAFLPVAKWLGTTAVEETKQELADTKKTYGERLDGHGNTLIALGKDMATHAADIRNIRDTGTRIESKLDRLIERAHDQRSTDHDA
jgi:hypothetical protein